PDSADPPLQPPALVELESSGGSPRGRWGLVAKTGPRRPRLGSRGFSWITRRPAALSPLGLARHRPLYPSSGGRTDPRIRKPVPWHFPRSSLEKPPPPECLAAVPPTAPPVPPCTHDSTRYAPRFFLSAVPIR